MTDKLRIQCNQLLTNMLGDQQLVELWWHSNNAGFDGTPPNTVFDKDPESVLAYLLLHFDGGW